MAVRYCGNARIRVLYRDEGDYRCSVSVEGVRLWRGFVSPPAAGYGPGISYDSPEAYDLTARAALAFAEHEARLDLWVPEYEQLPVPGRRTPYVRLHLRRATH